MGDEVGGDGIALHRLDTEVVLCTNLDLFASVLLYYSNTNIHYSHVFF